MYKVGVFFAGISTICGLILSVCWLWELCDLKWVSVLGLRTCGGSLHTVEGLRRRSANYNQWEWRNNELFGCGFIADWCTNKDISITQSRLGSTGIPQYSVQIVNTCISECAPTNVHVYCGWFASSPPPNPNTFTRLAYNDCLVNGGRPLAAGSIVEFQYSNSFMYALSFRSANFCRWIH